MSRASPARSARCGACMWLGAQGGSGVEVIQVLCGSGGGVPHHQLHFRFQQNVVKVQTSGGQADALRHFCHFSHTLPGKKNTKQLCHEIVGLASNRAAKVHSDLGEHDGTFVAKGVPSHDSRMFMLSSSGHAAQKDVVFM